MSITNNRIGGSITGATGVSVNNVINTNNSITGPTVTIDGFNLPTVQPGTASGYVMITNGTNTLGWTNSISGGGGGSGTSGTSGTSGINGYRAVMNLSYTGSSLTLGLGTQSLPIGTPINNLGWQQGTRVRIWNDATHYMEGQITTVIANPQSAYIDVNVDYVVGTGTFVAWYVGIAGDTGVAGTSGTSGVNGATGPAGSGGGSTFLQNPLLGQGTTVGGYWGKTTHDITNYTTANFTTAANRIYFIPFQEQAGYTIETFAFTVNTGAAGSTMSIAVYNCATQSLAYGIGSYVQTATVPGTATVIGTLNPTTSGDKVIQNINYTLPATINNTYYFAIQSTSATLSLKSWGSNIAVFPKWNTGALIGGIFYRAYNAEYTAPSFGFIDNIKGASYSQNTGINVLMSIYTTK